MRYLGGISDTYLCFTASDLKLEKFVDADLAGDIDIRKKNTTYFVFTLGGIVVSQGSNLQKVIALSTTETEYVAMTEATKKMVWLQIFYERVG